MRPDGSEQELFQLAFLNRISAGGNKVAWNQLEPDRRWGGRDYAVVVAHDLRLGRTVQLTRKTKLFAPVLSPSGAQIAAVEFTPERSCALVVLDAESGQEQERFPTPGNDFLQSPAWSADGALLVCTRQEAGGTAIAVVDLATGQWKTVVPASRETVSWPVLYRHYVLYNSPYTGIDNIWAIDLENSQRSQVTSRPYGAFNASVSPDSTMLLFQVYTADGYNVAEMRLDLVYQHTPRSGDYQSALFSARGALFFPGLRRHHGLRLQAGYERQVPQNYHFASELPFPRGYHPVFHHIFYGYHRLCHPPALPGPEPGHVLLLQAPQGDLVRRLGAGQDHQVHETYTASGVELAVDFRLFSLPLELTAGVRCLYRLKQKDTVLEPIFFGVSF